MSMKWWMVAFSICALACTLLTLLTQNASYFPLGIGLAFGVGILSAVYASRLRHANWSVLLVLLTVGGVASFCSGQFIGLAHAPPEAGIPTPTPPDIVQQIYVLTLAPIVVLPLAALLSAFLLRPREPRLATPVEPPAGTNSA
jgi:hypothetical protein